MSLYSLNVYIVPINDRWNKCFISLIFQVGDFYEALGIDACILVEYAGLNPFGGLRSDSIPRAGCPVVVLIICMLYFHSLIFKYSFAFKFHSASHSELIISLLILRNLYIQIVKPYCAICMRITWFNEVLNGFPMVESRRWVQICDSKEGGFNS